MDAALGPQKSAYVAEIEQATVDYRKLDPGKYFITAYWDKDRETYTAALWVNTEDGPLKMARLSQNYSSREVALRFAAREFEVIAIINTDSHTFEWPEYNEVKGHFMAEARAKRERRIQKALGLVSIAGAVAGRYSPGL